MKMMKKRISLLLGTALLSLGGCISLDGNGGSNSSTAVSELNNIKFNLPPQVQWVTAKQDVNMTVFIPKAKGVTPNNSPITIVYRKASVTDAAGLANQIAQSLSGSCQKILNNRGRSNSQYANKAHLESVCNQVKGKKVGRFNSVAIFSGSKESHMLLAEVKTLPTAQPGKFAPKTAAEKAAVSNTTAQIAAVQQMMTQALACDSKGNCQ